MRASRRLRDARRTTSDGPWSSSRSRLQFRRRAATADNRNPDPLALRVTEEKKRSVWSFSSGSAICSPRRSTPDASASFVAGGRASRSSATLSHWLPLIQFTIGPRPEEAAALRKDLVRLRDGILCFAFEMRPDARQKNEASERLVPVSDLLLRLGFAEWWREQLMLPGDFLSRAAGQRHRRQTLGPVRKRIVIFDPVDGTSPFLSGVPGRRLINVAASRAMAHLIGMTVPADLTNPFLSHLLARAPRLPFDPRKPRFRFL